MIHYRNTVRRSGVDARSVKRTATFLLGALGHKQATLSISFVGDDEIRELNHVYRGKNASTDVLSFPLQPSPEPNGAKATLQPEQLLGDVVISVETARRQAADYDATLEAEVNRLLIHGVLHIVGHDHEEVAEQRRMRAEERRLADAIGLPWPYEE